MLPEPENKKTDKSQRANFIIFSGALLCLLLWAIQMISSRFLYQIPRIEQPILGFTVLYGLSGIVFLTLLRVIFRNKILRRNILVVVVFGLVMRLIMIFSTPILEDDFYRYLWDGAVTANGINPYRYSPEDIQNTQNPTDFRLKKLKILVNQSGAIFERINFPSIRTIYPPITQAAFAISYLIKPWKLWSWRFLLLLVDLLNFFLIFKILKKLKKPQAWAVIYWWNPLLIKEIFNSGHMDILIFPFLLLSIYFFLNKQILLAAAGLGLAAGVKFWPVVLLPVILRPVFKSPGKLIFAEILFMLLIFVMIYPQYSIGVDAHSAFQNYSHRWESNTALFPLLVRFSRFVLKSRGIHPGFGQWMARLILFSIMIFWTIRVAWRPVENSQDQMKRMLSVLIALFLLSPTQFPWYFVWLLPLLVFEPKNSLLLFTALLPLYYLKYYFESHSQPQIFENIIIWIEFVPVWILLIWETWKIEIPAGGEKRFLRLKVVARLDRDRK